MNNIKELRLQRKLTQKQLADLLGTDQTGISKWEKGICLPVCETVIKMAEIFNVSIDYLLGISRYIYPSNVGVNNLFNFEELDIIEKYRSLPPELQKTIRDTLAAFSAQKPPLLK